ATAWFASRSVPFRFHFRDSESALLDEGRRRGFTQVDHEPAMALSLDSWSPPAVAGITVRRAVTDADIRRYAQVDGPAWHEITEGIARTARTFPDFELLLGEVDGEAVATSMAVVTRDVVGVFNVQTQPRARGHGFGTALTAAAMEVGRERGATTAALQATEMGFPVYTKMGFVQRYSYVVLASPEASPA
ncbi:MAG: GNAT family N-acetyltransferase, partial [Tepidiformaceae bacterium]